MLTATIDWIAGTFKEWNNEAENFVRTYASFAPVQAGKPRNGYRVCESDNCGSDILWNPNNQSMGVHVVFSGTALRNIFERQDIQPLALLRACVDAGLRVSRLDLAKDCTETAFDGQAIYNALEQGAGNGTTRTVGRIVSNGGGDTIYVGSRQSERFIRVYNKAAQTGDTTSAWWRMEVETKGDVARVVAQSLSETNSISRVFDGICLRMVGKPEMVGLAPMFAVVDAPFGLPKVTKTTDRETWIAEQVTGAIAKHYIDNPNSAAIANLRATLDLIDRQRKK